MQQKNTERLKFHDFNICPNILHADADADADADKDADADAGGIAIALLHLSAGALKMQSKIIRSTLLNGSGKILF